MSVLEQSVPSGDNLIDLLRGVLSPTENDAIWALVPDREADFLHQVADLHRFHKLTLDPYLWCAIWARLERLERSAT